MHDPSQNLPARHESAEAADTSSGVMPGAIGRRAIIGSGAAATAMLSTSALFSTGLIRAVHAATQGKPIVIAMPNEQESMTQTAGLNDNYLARHVERSLLNYDTKDGTFRIVPEMASALPEILDGGLRFRFQLRDNMYYHDGTKVDADSIANWIMMQVDKNHPQNGLYKWRLYSRLASVDKAVAVDRLVLDVHMKKLNAAQMDWFVSPGYGGGPKSVLKVNPDLINKEYGTGPYTVIERRKGAFTMLGKFDKFYRPDEGMAPRLALRPITESSSRIAALQAGEVDWIDAISTEEANFLKKVGNVVVGERKTLYVWFMSLDMRKPPFNDVRVRQALNYALNKEALIRDVLGGAAERSYAPLSPQFGDFYAGNAVRKYDYDPDRAKALLKEAGLGGGFKSTIYTNTGRAGQLKPVEMSQFVQANWRAIGVDCTIEAMEWNVFETRRNKGDFAIATRGWTPSTADPDGLLFQNFHSSMIPPTNRNVPYLQDPEVDRHIDKGMRTLEHEARAQAFRDAQSRIVELAPWVFVCHEIAYEAYNRSLENYKIHPEGFGVALTRAIKR